MTELDRTKNDEITPTTAGRGRRSRLLFVAGAIPLLLACVTGGIVASGQVGLRHERNYPYRQLPADTDRITVHVQRGFDQVAIDQADEKVADINGLVRPFMRLSRVDCNLPVGDDVDVSYVQTPAVAGRTPAVAIDVKVKPPPGDPVVQCRNRLSFYVGPKVSVVVADTLRRQDVEPR